MNYSEQNGHTYCLTDDCLYVDGIAYKLPKKSKSQSMTNIDGKIYVNGYEFKNGKFIKTLSALWHKWF